VANTPWRHRRVEAGGISLDVGVHRFDLIRHLAGEIQDIQARTAIVEPVRFSQDERGYRTERVECDAEDTVYASFVTAAGATGELIASWAGRGGMTLLGAGEVFYASRGRVSGEEVFFEDGTTANLAQLYEEGCPAARKAKDFPLGLTDTFALAQYEWLQAVREHRPPETNGRDALASLSCAFAVLESAEAGRRLNVADVLSGRICQYQRDLDEHYRTV
jgi:predicted dehydrogenase